MPSNRVREGGPNMRICVRGSKAEDLDVTLLRLSDTMHEDCMKSDRSLP